jgi:hypothetical protein
MIRRRLAIDAFEPNPSSNDSDEPVGPSGGGEAKADTIERQSRFESKIVEFWERR